MRLPPNLSIRSPLCFSSCKPLFRPAAQRTTASEIVSLGFHLSCSQKPDPLIKAC
jgi:hypothetical protein